MSGGEIRCPKCGTVYVEAKEYSGQTWLGTQAADLREVGKPAKPWQPRPRINPAPWLAPGILIGLATTGTLALAGVSFSAGELLGTAVTTSCAGMLAWNQLEQARARRPLPRKQSTTVRVSVDGGGGGARESARESLNIDCSIKVLEVFAAEYLVTGKTSETALTGRDRPLSREDLRILREALIRGGYARWNSDKHTAQGWDLTAKGKAVMTEIAPLPRARART